MEKLEKTLIEIPLEKPELKSEGSYDGLQLIEEGIYMAGTSIKYWM